MREWHIDPEQARAHRRQRPDEQAALAPERDIDQLTPDGPREPVAGTPIEEPTVVPTPPVAPESPRAFEPSRVGSPAEGLSAVPSQSDSRSPEAALADLIARYHAGAISRERYRRDKQLLLARINPEAVTFKRYVQAPVVRAVEPEARLARRASNAQAAFVVAVVLALIVFVAGLLWAVSPLPTSDQLLRRAGATTPA